VIDASISHYCNLEGCGCVVERGGRPTRPGPRAKIMHWVCFFISQNTTYMYTSMFSAHACLQQTCKSRQERAGWQGRVPCSRETVHTASRPLKAGDGALVRGGADLRLHGILLRKHLTLSAMRVVYHSMQLMSVVLPTFRIHGQTIRHTYRFYLCQFSRSLGSSEHFLVVHFRLLSPPQARSEDEDRGPCEPSVQAALSLAGHLPCSVTPTRRVRKDVVLMRGECGYVSQTRIRCQATSCRDHRFRICHDSSIRRVQHGHILTDFYIRDMLVSTASYHAWLCGDLPLLISHAAERKRHQYRVESCALTRPSKYETVAR
jgi:hypothetical protein